VTAVDLGRAVRLRVVDADAIDAPGSLPGDAVPTERDGGAPAGFIFRCPGCGAQSCLGLAPRLDHAPAWNVTAGDPRTGAGLSLTPVDPPHDRPRRLRLARLPAGGGLHAARMNSTASRANTRRPSVNRTPLE
jgi:hypothetical protein